LNDLHSSIDSLRGATLLSVEKGIDLSSPHWIKNNTLTETETSIVSTLLGDSRGGIQHRYSIRSSNAEFISAFEKRTGISLKSNTRQTKRADGSNSDLYKILDIAKACTETAESLNSPIRVCNKAKLVDGKSLDVVSASSLIQGDYIPTYYRGNELMGPKILLDEIIQIKTYPAFGTYYDFEVEGTHNFITEHIVHSNSIYGWRGAKPENIQQLHKDFDDVSEVVLPRNYRSTSSILDAAQRLIRHNKDAEDVELHSSRGGGATVKVTSHAHPEEEADRLIFHIKSLRQIYDYDWKDFAILYRTNSLSRAPEMALRTKGIPYRIVGGFSFFDRMEIKAAISYLTLLVNPHDTINFNRAITHPKRGLGGESIGRLELLCENGDSIIDVARNSESVKLTAKARANLKTFVSMIDRYKNKDCKLSELAEGIIKESGLYEFVKTLPEKTITDKSRLENLEEFIAGIIDFEQNRPDSTLVDYLQSIQLVITGDDDASDNSIKLLTIHSAKGLEWPCVNIIGVENGCIPHPKAESERGAAEERRLMYVAMTRSRDILHISYCKKRRKGSRIVVCKPSIFIEEFMGSGNMSQII